MQVEQLRESSHEDGDQGAENPDPDGVDREIMVFGRYCCTNVFIHAAVNLSVT